MDLVITLAVGVLILGGLFWLAARITRSGKDHPLPNANDGFFNSTLRQGEDRPFD
ncbi:hypothetical protein HNR19_001337 [Nocardioides thalensis]|uniref:Uncharacterized protein n=1 Tax=Nocardioides thalensis TaxID=1914755 RepID=A0A853BZR0_9ACTN|nr:hypothetical protein [Nocardioides thalensis]NYJ00639.1 hypothetical protein [Nocardioides thalensis]